MNQAHNFRPNVDHLVPFNSQVMLINDIPDSENGMNLIKANTDGPPIHAHPFQEEAIHVVEGTLEFFHRGKWNVLHEGERIYVKKNEPHSYRNRSNAQCIFEYRITPKGSFSDMMRTLEHLSKAGKLATTKDLRSLIYLSMTFKKYKRDVVSVQPPPFVINIFNTIGKLLGFKL